MVRNIIGLLIELGKGKMDSVSFLFGQPNTYALIPISGYLNL